VRREGAVTEGVPIPARLPDTPCVLRAWIYSHALSARYYGCPVYLVGGALTDPDPRDLDIVVRVPDALFLAMYCDGKGDIAGWHDGKRESDPPTHWRRWARDCAKQGAQMTHFCARAVDFKTQPATFFATYDDKPRVRLDCGLMPTRSET
jgi:hypothetical protein